MSSRTRPRLSHVALVAATVMLSGSALAGCGTGTGTAAGGAGSGTSAATDGRPSESGSAPASSSPASPSEPSPSEPSPSGAASEAAPGSDPAEQAAGSSAGSSAGRTTLTARLLSASELPVPASGFRWAEGRTQRREPAALAGTCHRYSMLSIGAMAVAHRTYAPAQAGSSARADQLVARFADAKTAWRAFEVLKSWARDCDQALAGHDRHTVGPLRAVRADARAAHWYLLSYGPAGSADEDWFDAQGLALVGSRMTVLRIRTSGQDYDYPAGKEPMVAAVRAAAAKLR